MQIKQAANSWQQLKGMLLQHPEKNLFTGHKKQKNQKRK